MSYTEEFSHTTMSDKKNSRLGPALRSVRRRLGITLAEVSKRSGITASTLSRVENNGASLTYDKLVRLAEGLSVDIAEFFRATNDPSGHPMVTARRSIDRSDGVVVETPRYLYRYLHTDISGKQLVPVITERLLNNVKNFGEYHRHPGEEFIYVLEGTMDLYTEFYGPMRVEAGQSVYIDSSMGHAYIAVGSTPCRILGVMTAPHGDNGPEPFAITEQATLTPPAETEAAAPRRRTVARSQRKRRR
jgi:transcriptional regulator with XRE-family HTH domain